MTKFNFETFPTLETDRLILRRITTDDMQAWFDLHQNEDVLRYLTDFEVIPDEDEINSMIEWCDGVFSRKTGIRWAITLKQGDNMIGSCGFHLYDSHNRCLEIGYELHRDHWRKGIMSEAVSEVIRFCFEGMHVHRIEANVTSGNDASAGLLRRLGFTLEGTWRDKTYWKGQFHDLWQFGLLEEEYNKDNSK